MNDLISRQSAIDAIHNLYAIHGSEGSWIDQKDAFKALNSLPSAQPELVRCKDCKWYYRGGATCMYWDGENSMRGDDFCSKAERKEE